MRCLRVEAGPTHANSRATRCRRSGGPHQATAARRYPPPDHDDRATRAEDHRERRERAGCCHHGVRSSGHPFYPPYTKTPRRRRFVSLGLRPGTTPIPAATAAISPPGSSIAGYAAWPRRYGPALTREPTIANATAPGIRAREPTTERARVVPTQSALVPTPPGLWPSRGTPAAMDATKRRRPRARAVDERPALRCRRSGEAACQRLSSSRHSRTHD